MKKVIIIVSSLILAIIVILFVMFKVMFISKEEVRNIILEDQNLSSSDVSRWNIDFEYEDGYFEYDVDVIIDRVKHEFVVDAKSGEIILHDIDR